MSTAQSNARWLSDTQSFEQSLEEIKNHFKQMAEDINALRVRAEDCEKGIYVYQNWAPFTRTLSMLNIIADKEKLDRIRNQMDEGLGFPETAFPENLDTDFSDRIPSDQISEPDPNRKISTPKVYPTSSAI